MTEVFLNFTWQDGWKWQPFKLVDYRKDEGSGFGDYNFPVFDLDTWEELVWGKWAQIFSWAKEIGICLFVRIMDQCSLKDRFERRHNAFRSNIQRFDLGTLTGGLYDRVIEKWYHKLNERVVRELDKAGCEYVIVPWNEFDVIKNGWTDQEAEQHGLETMRWFVSNLVGHGVRRDRILISTSIARNKMAEWGYKMEEHGINSDVSLISAVLNLGHGIFPNGDGLDPHAAGRMGDKPSKREPSVEQAIQMRNELRVTNMWYGYFNRATETGIGNGLGDVENAQFDVLRALTGGSDE